MKIRSKWWRTDQPMSSYEDWGRMLQFLQGIGLRGIDARDILGSMERIERSPDSVSAMRLLSKINMLIDGEGVEVRDTLMYVDRYPRRARDSVAYDAAAEVFLLSSLDELTGRVVKTSVRKGRR